jgi:hypothetical protein
VVIRGPKLCNCAKTWKSETSDSRDSLVASAPVASDAKTPAVMRIEAPATLVWSLASPVLFLCRLRFWRFSAQLKLDESRYVTGTTKVTDEST